MSACAELIAEVKQQGNPNDTSAPPILVSLEDFFEGNDDFGSIGCNLSEQPSPVEFYSVLKAVRSRKDVQNVLVRIRMIEFEAMWPFSDTIYILTSALISEVSSWFASLKPDEVYDNARHGIIPDWPVNLPFVCELHPGMRLVYAWWD